MEAVAGEARQASWDVDLLGWDFWVVGDRLVEAGECLTAAAAAEALRPAVVEAAVWMPAGAGAEMEMTAGAGRRWRAAVRADAAADAAVAAA